MGKNQYKYERRGAREENGGWTKEHYAIILINDTFRDGLIIARVGNIREADTLVRHLNRD